MRAGRLAFALVAIWFGGCLDLASIVGDDGEVAKGGKPSLDGASFGGFTDASNDSTATDSVVKPDCAGFAIPFEDINPKCAPCMQASCCNELTECGKVDSCKDYASCIACLASGACTTDCTPQDPQADALIQCVVDHCLYACQKCSGFGGTIPLGKSCDECVKQNTACCDAARACGDDPKCRNFTECSLQSKTNCGTAPPNADAIAACALSPSGACYDAGCDACGNLKDYWNGVSDACWTCAKGGCCAESYVCAKSFACRSIGTCIAGGGAEATCKSQNPDGAGEFDTLVHCLNSKSCICP